MTPRGWRVFASVAIALVLGSGIVQTQSGLKIVVKGDGQYLVSCPR